MTLFPGFRLILQPRVSINIGRSLRHVTSRHGKSRSWGRNECIEGQFLQQQENLNFLTWKGFYFFSAIRCRNGIFDGRAEEYSKYTRTITNSGVRESKHDVGVAIAGPPFEIFLC